MENIILSVRRQLTCCRLSLASELALHSDIARVLDLAGIPFKREVHLGSKMRIDFIVAGRIGMEVKIKGGVSDIFRQCRKYCLSPDIAALILATNRPMGLPETIEGKPAYYISLGQAWL